jgi:hypothetical protein
MGMSTVQVADNIHEFPVGSFVQIPRGTPDGQRNFTKRPVKLLVTVSPGGGFERCYLQRAELFEKKRSNKGRVRKGAGSAAQQIYPGNR